MPKADKASFMPKGGSPRSGPSTQTEGCMAVRRCLLVKAFPWDTVLDKCRWQPGKALLRKGQFPWRATSGAAREEGFVEAMKGKAGFPGM